MQVQGVNDGQALTRSCGLQGAKRAGAATAMASGPGQQMPAGPVTAAHPAYPQPPGSTSGHLSSISLGAVLGGQESSVSDGVSQGSRAAPGRQALELTMSQAAQSYLQPGQGPAWLRATA